MNRRTNPLALGAMAGALLFAVAFFGFIALAERDTADQSGRMAQINAQMDAAEASIQRAAAVLCASELGPGTQVLWTAQGDLVCRPATLTAGGAQ